MYVPLDKLIGKAIEDSLNAGAILLRIYQILNNRLPGGSHRFDRGLKRINSLVRDGPFRFARKFRKKITWNPFWMAEDCLSFLPDLI